MKQRQNNHPQFLRLHFPLELTCERNKTRTTERKGQQKWGVLEKGEVV